MTALPARRAGPEHGAGSALLRVRSILDALIGDFDLAPRRPQILGAYDAILRDSLDVSSGGGPPAASRLNEDGTPIQFATAVGARTSSLRFVGDPGRAVSAGAARIGRVRAALEEVAGIVDVRPQLDRLWPLMDSLAPANHRTLLADSAGAFWIGVAFTPDAAPRMRIYVNGAWGPEARRRARASAFADHFGQGRTLQRWSSLLHPALSHLGMAVTLAPGCEAKGALYLRAFGLRIDDYADIARRIGGAANAEMIHTFGTMLLAEEVRFPVASAVLSLTFGGSRPPAVELELCAHCLFRDDEEAGRRVLALSAAAGFDAGPYRALAGRLPSGSPTAGPPRVHSFIGLDGKSAPPAYTLYMKPDLAVT